MKYNAIEDEYEEYQLIYEGVPEHMKYLIDENDGTGTIKEYKDVK